MRLYVYYSKAVVLVVIYIYIPRRHPTRVCQTEKGRLNQNHVQFKKRKGDGANLNWMSLVSFAKKSHCIIKLIYIYISKATPTQRGQQIQPPTDRPTNQHQPYYSPVRVFTKICMIVYIILRMTRYYNPPHNGRPDTS